MVPSVLRIELDLLKGGQSDVKADELSSLFLVKAFAFSSLQLELKFLSCLNDSFFEVVVLGSQPHDTIVVITVGDDCAFATAFDTELARFSMSSIVLLEHLSFAAVVCALDHSVITFSLMCR